MGKPKTGRAGMPQDIFESGFKFPERVDILAPGPQGKSMWDRLGPWVMTVNKGIDIPVDPDAWMVADWWAVKTDWFPRMDKEYKGIRFFSEGLVSKRTAEVAEAEYKYKLLDGRKCTFPLGSALYGEPIPGVLRPDGSVSACAVEAAARLGAKEIVLCGADMFGNIYYDGGPSSSVDCSHNGIWAFAPYMNSLIEWVKEQGVEIYSISPTALDIEVRSG